MIVNLSIQYPECHILGFSEACTQSALSWHSSHLEVNFPNTNPAGLSTEFLELAIGQRYDYKSTESESDFSIYP